ncbi:S1 family peptidase [Streptomyces roseolus]|uniref:S1 family peptidase n=1 Tax=Streptomyces roseolus TaxID=67358 RepID=UPI00378A9B79
MAIFRARRYLAAGLPSALVLSAVTLASASTATAETSLPGADAMAYAVEDHSYPEAERIKAEKGITLKSGDGQLLLAACDGTQDIMVNSRAGLKDYCFDIKSRPALLSLALPDTYGIWTEAYPVKSTIEANGTKTVIDAPAHDFTGYGEATQNGVRSTLIELRVTGENTNPPAPSGDNPQAYLGKVRIGDTRSCTAALVDPRWVVTAKSCFADKPDESTTVAAGAPKEKTTVTLGRSDLATSGGHTANVVEILPHADRDLLLARLAAPVTDITPLKRAGSTPAAGTTLTAAGFGRTTTEWVPDKRHTGSFTVTASDDATLSLTGNGDDVICKGDAGGPLLNAAGELVGVNSRSWQGGCLGTDPAETRTGAVAARTDNVGQWIDRTIAPRNGGQVSLLAGGAGAMWSQSGDLGYGEYGSQ